MHPRDATLKLGGVWRNGKGLARCPVIEHGQGRGDLNPSLSITAGRHQQLLVHCFAGCDPLDVLWALRAGPGSAAPPTRPGAAAVTPARVDNDIWRRAWFDARDPLGTIAETYLVAHRRVATASQIGQWLGAALRYAADAPFSTDGRWRAPALLAAIRSRDGVLTGIQVTGLRPDGRGKIAARKTRHTFGTIGRGAVQIGSPSQCRRSRALSVAEGVESAIGFATLTGYACWATLGASLASFDPPEEIDELVIAADNDAPGLKAAQALQRRLGRERPTLLVDLRAPDGPGRDWADEAHARG